jgi:hypothetical protein
LVCAPQQRVALRSSNSCLLLRRFCCGCQAWLPCCLLLAKSCPLQVELQVAQLSAVNKPPMWLIVQQNLFKWVYMVVGKLITFGGPEHVTVSRCR